MIWMEISMVTLILVMAVTVLAGAWRGAVDEIFSPRVFFSLMILYYAVFGPLLALILGDGGLMVDVYVRPVIWKGWLGSAVAYSCFLAGYARKRRRFRPVETRTDDNAVLIVATFFFAGAAAAMTFWMFRFGGGLDFLNPAYKEEAAFLSASGFEVAGAVYLLQFINLGFGAATLLLLYTLERHSLLAWCIFWVVTIFCVLFFLKSGFRYRLAWLAVGIATAYFLWKRVRPQLWLGIPLAITFIAVMGVIGATRNYWGGLSLDKAAEMKPVDVVLNGFAEAGTFFTLSQVMDAVPRDLPHTSWDPVWVAVTSAIPRTFWASKPASGTLDTIAAAFGTKSAYEAGMAVPYFGEWYIAFGWTGIVVSSLIFGLLSRALWDWYRRRQRDKFVLVIYSVGLGFMYLAFSRGLLAQVLMNFCFSLLPLLVIYRLLPKVRMGLGEFPRRPMPVGRAGPPGSELAFHRNR